MNDFSYLIGSSNVCDFNKEFASLISEIESNSCGSIANVIRKLRQLENASPNNSSNEILTRFMRQLDNEINIRDQDIEKFCNHYYQGFVESIKELLKIQEDANNLKHSFSGIQKSLDDSVKKVKQDCNELSNCYSVLNNIDKAIEYLQTCLPVFDQYLKANKSINEKRYYPALKTLYNLETNQMQRVRQFAFSEVLQNQIPGMQDKIKSASRDEIKDFLENVRKHSVGLGMCAMKQMAMKSGMDISFDNTKRKTVNGISFNKTGENKQVNLYTGIIDEPDSIDKEISELLSIDSFNKDNEDSLETESSNVEDLIDFGPVYRCLHIHSVLGDRHEFEKSYRSQRKSQHMLLLTLTKQESVRNYYEFFSGIVGFFVIEDYIRHSQISMVTRNYLDELWNHTHLRVGDFVNANSEHIPDIDTLLRLKDSCVLFGKIMRSLGFNVVCFKDFYEALRKRHQLLLEVEHSNKFKDIFEGEDYTAIFVQDSSEMELIVDLYPTFLSPDIDALSYPKSLSFSWMVPRIYQAVREHIKKSKKFSDNLEMSQTELEDQLNHITNILFTQTLRPFLVKAVKDSERELNRLIQLAVNMDELKSACSSIQNFILTLVGTVYIDSQHYNSSSTIDTISSEDNNHGTTTTTSGSRSRLHAFALFSDLYSKIEDNIYKAIYSKIDDMFDENEYRDVNSHHSSASNSLTNSPSRKPGLTSSIISSSSSSSDTNQLMMMIKPSVFITDVIGYLRSTFESFTNLPARLAQTACLLCCKYINNKLKNFIERETRISEKFLQQLSIDIKTLKDFTRKIPVAGVKLEKMILVFEELRQLTDLVLLSDWSTYIQNYNTPGNPYDLVFKSSAISLWEKTRNSDTGFSALLKSIKKNKQDKRDEEILKQLKDLK